MTNFCCVVEIVGAATIVPLTLFAVGEVDHAISAVTFSAGLSGAVGAAVIKAQRTLQQEGNKNTWSVSVMAGVTTAILGVLAATGLGPALCSAANLQATEWRMAAHFTLGIIGSSVLGWVFDNPGKILRVLLGQKAPDVPPSGKFDATKKD